MNNILDAKLNKLEKMTQEQLNILFYFNKEWKIITYDYLGDINTSITYEDIDFWIILKNNEKENGVIQILNVVEIEISYARLSKLNELFDIEFIAV